CATVVVTYSKDTTKAQALIQSMNGEGHLVIQADIQNIDSLKTLSEKIDAQFGALDLLVNCAGVTTPVKHNNLDALSDEWIDKIFQVNWRGAFATIRAMKPLLEKGEQSTIINISSVAGITGVGSNVAYCASKAALDSMTRSLGRALAPKIRVVSVSPGWVLGEYASRFDPEYIQAQVDATPLKKLSTPEDVAETVWAVHTKLKMMTGNIVPVDGGRPLGV
ncbi:MAG TPA: short-chain dehydrogenase, partial [Flavobacteriales bacterium]|nr:short-chain dehydrogenase [Flavobacteriales bacterium]